ncbi:DUF938 domain-containing protein [Rhodobacteraceae bacterium M382]|nr:DUF938 domain-containing protein [Rhodobacteraceae bacterium M382]
MPRRSVPTSASVAQTQGDKMIAPSASRNRTAICDLLVQIAPPEGLALELASGTGQHVALFAQRLPGLRWQPTEIDTARHPSILAHVTDAGVSNVLEPVAVDATAPGWGHQHSGQSLIVVINLLHLIAESEVQTLIHEAAQALAPGGRFVIYGPFRQGGELISDADRAFDASLTAHDPAIGYKDDFDTMDWVQDAGLEMSQIIEMPANNLALIAEKPVF